MVPVSNTDLAVGVSLPAAVPLDRLNANALGRKAPELEVDAMDNITTNDAVNAVNIITYSDLLKSDIKS
jgi:hypothetical protein